MEILFSNTINLLILALTLYAIIKFTRRLKIVDFIFGILLSLFSVFYKISVSSDYASCGFPMGYIQISLIKALHNVNFDIIFFAVNAFIWTLLIRLFRFITEKF